MYTDDSLKSYSGLRELNWPIPQPLLPSTTTYPPRRSENTIPFLQSEHTLDLGTLFTHVKDRLKCVFFISVCRLKHTEQSCIIQKPVITAFCFCQAHRVMISGDHVKPALPGRDFCDLFRKKSPPRSRVTEYSNNRGSRWTVYASTHFRPSLFLHLGSKLNKKGWNKVSDSCGYEMSSGCDFLEPLLGI